MADTYFNAGAELNSTQSTVVAALASLPAGAIGKKSADGTTFEASEVIFPAVTIGPGGVASVDLAFSAGAYPGGEILFRGLFKKRTKAYLQADSADGMQERWRDDAGTVKATRPSPARVWLSMAGTPAVVGSTPTGNGTYALVAYGTRAYALNYTAGTITVLNIADPSTPVVVGNAISCGRRPTCGVIVGAYLYVVCQQDSTIWTFSLANPDVPAAIGTGVACESGAYGMTAIGSYLYVPGYTSGYLRGYSLADPTTPAAVGTHVATGTGPYAIAAAGTRLYVISITTSDVKTYNTAADATTPALESTVSTPQYPYGLSINGTDMWITGTGVNNMQRFSLATPGTPVAAGSLVTTGVNPQFVLATGDYVYVSCYTDKVVQVWDASGGSTPVLVGSASSGTGSQGMVLVDEYILVALNNATGALAVLDVSTARSGRLFYYPGDVGKILFELHMLTKTGRVMSISGGWLPAWATKLTITSTATDGLLAGGIINFRGRVSL